jgi:hypothetical protein
LQKILLFRKDTFRRPYKSDAFPANNAPMPAIPGVMETEKFELQQLKTNGEYPNGRTNHFLPNIPHGL